MDRGPAAIRPRAGAQTAETLLKDHRRSVGSSAADSPAKGAGMRAFAPDSQRQNSQPSVLNTAAPNARCKAEWLSSGESTPAMIALDTSPQNACSDDALPRWRGYMSRMASVRIGKTSAMPKELSIIGSTAHGTEGCGTSRL